MAKTREKKVVYNKPIKREDAEAAFAEYADADARQQKIQSEIDVRITALREKYQDEIIRLQEAKDKNFDKLQAYADQNPELFTKKKSSEFTHGIIGFRTGTPKLKTMKGFTWASALNLVKNFLPGYVRVEEAVNKEAIISDRDNSPVKDNLRNCGMIVEQDETFYVEPKKELVTS